MVNLLQSAASFFLITVILLLWFPQYHQFAIASYPILLFGHKCIASGHYAPNSYFHYNFEKVFTNLTSAAALTGFYNTTITTSTHPAHGLFLCRGDVSHQDCYDCVHNAILTLLEECPFQTSASIWYNLCMLRYSDESFFGKLDDLPGTFLPNLGNFTSNVTKAMQIIKETVIELAMEVANNSKKFGTNEVNLHSYRTTVHVLEQCTLDLSENDCFHCLQEAINQIPNCCYGRQGARLLLPSCNVRYELYPFYNKSAIALETPGSAAISPTVNASHTGKGKQQPNRRKRWPHIYAIVTVPAVIGVLLIFGIQICKRRRKAKEIFSVNIDEIEAAESLRFELSSIKAATCNFSAENQLGEGGFGKVYKGKLENGQEVAVKRLSKNSRQGILEFITEVVLVAKLQHKNLVKLFGFCLASREKILVYELLPNASLDRFLFDPVKRVTLDWKTRFKIINGIARGLLYLHEDSRLKIIHRDLKPSNILLDEVMNPKISDFGLARLSGVDQTQGNTKRIAGTYGYMAPEYALAGHFSVKSDVYSFGVMILEIVSSQRNRIFDRAKDEEELLHRAWRLWNEGVVSQLADEALSNKYSSEEITKCIHIGLLCIQEDATKRPGMATIVAALNGQSIPLPLPTPPRLFTTTAEDNSEALEHENEIQGSNFQVRTLTGTENITDLYPR